MTERTTGATDAQIEAAAERRLDETSWIAESRNRYRPLWREEAIKHAAYLVPPDQVIVDAAKVPTAEELAAMRRILLARDDGNEDFAALDVLSAYLDRQP